MVDVFLKALAVVARGQSTAGSFGEETSLNALGLGVGGPGVVLDDHTPFTIGVLGTEWTGILDVAWADETFSANPITLIELFAVVERVVEFLLLHLGDTID